MKRIILIAATLFTISACSIDDKGSYTYTELNSVSIEDINTSYSKLSRVDNLTITPTLTGSLSGENLDDYEYHWYICQGVHEHTTLSREKNLDWNVDLPAGTYSIHFWIKDKGTGLEWHKSTSLSVTTPYTKGFLLLGDDENGKVRMDMIVMPSGRDTTIVEEIYANSENEINAQSIIFTGSTNEIGTAHNKQSLYLTSEAGSMKLTSSASLEAEKKFEQFTNIGTIEDLRIALTTFDITYPMIIKDVFPHQTKNGASRSKSKRGIITEDYIGVAEIIQGEYFSIPVNRYQADSKKLFKPYPLAFVRSGDATSYEGYTVFYDMDADEFVAVNDNSFFTATHCRRLYDNTTDNFMWNARSEQRKLVYGENSNNANAESYAIMRDEEGNYYIYTFLVNGFTPNKRAFNPIDLNIATGFEQASLYAFSSAKTVVLYSVGSTLYAYDFSRKQFTSMNLGAEITCLEAEYQSRGSLADIIVATFDDASQKGTVRKLTVGGGNNAVELTEKPNEKWDITLKVKDIEWKYSN